MSGDKQRHLLSGYFTDAEWERLLAICANEERSMASLVSRVLRTYLEVLAENEAEGRKSK